MFMAPHPTPLLAVLHEEPKGLTAYGLPQLLIVRCGTVVIWQHPMIIMSHLARSAAKELLCEKQVIGCQGLGRCADRSVLAEQNKCSD